MDEIYDVMSDLMLKHCHKFDYRAKSIPEIHHLAEELCFEGNINEDVLELKKLVEDSLKDNKDYLPERYNYNSKDLMGDVNDILIDYYDH